MILSMGYGIDISRATADIDLGINVSSWDEFNQLKVALTNTGLFSENRARQRLMYNNSIPVDIVPFGAISSADGNIRWPPDQDEVMNIAGFEDAFNLRNQFGFVKNHRLISILPPTWTSGYEAHRLV